MLQNFNIFSHSSSESYSTRGTKEPIKQEKTVREKFHAIFQIISYQYKKKDLQLLHEMFE